MRVPVFLVSGLVGLYVVASSNIVSLPDQITWVTNGDISFKLILPTIMLVASFLSVAYGEILWFQHVAFYAVVLDANVRIATLINHYYWVISYEMETIPDTTGAVLVVSYVPVIVILCIETFLIGAHFWPILRLKRLRRMTL